MSYPEHERAAPLVCAVDRDATYLDEFQRVAEAQGMNGCSAHSAAELRGNVRLESMVALVLDLEACGEEGIRLQRDLLRHDVPTSIILTTNTRLTDETIESLGLGAIVVLPRPWDSELMGQYLKFADAQYSQQQTLRKQYARMKQILSMLTDRQRAVLELAATGMPNKLIATEIDVSQRTVEAERSKLLEVFHARSCADAMISLGEYRILDQLERLRRRSILQRLSMHSAYMMEEPSSSGLA